MDTIKLKHPDGTYHKHNILRIDSDDDESFIRLTVEYSVETPIFIFLVGFNPLEWKCPQGVEVLTWGRYEDIRDDQEYKE